MTAPETPPTINEIFAVLIARDLREEDRVIMVGANQPMAVAGAAMANMTRLPNSRVMLGLSIQSLAGLDGLPAGLPFSLDPRTLKSGEAWMRQHEVFDYLEFPDVFFFGGLQVDRRGNVNLLGISSGGRRWLVRGPGPLAQPTISSHCRGSYILMTRHDPSSFVDRVHYVSALGDRDLRAKYCLPGGGPRLVFSPLGVFEFDDAGDMGVRSVHPGVTNERLREATGFPIDVSAGLPTTPAPTIAELTFLRERVDTSGVLRRTS